MLITVLLVVCAVCGAAGLASGIAANDRLNTVTGALVLASSLLGLLA